MTFLFKTFTTGFANNHAVLVMRQANCEVVIPDEVQTACAPGMNGPRVQVGKTLFFKGFKILHIHRLFTQ